MALSLGIIEGFDYISSSTEYSNLSGLSWTASGWSLKQTGRISGFALRGPLNTSAPLVYNVNRLDTSISLTDTFILNLSMKCDLSVGQRRIRFMDSADVVHLDFEITTAGTIICKRGDGSTLGSSAAGVVTDNVWGTIEIIATINDTTGAVTVKWEGVTVITFTATDTQNAGTAEIAKVELTPAGYIDHLVGWVAASTDSLPTPHKVIFKTPASDALVDFARNTGASAVDDANDGDSTYTSSSTVNEEDFFNLQTVTEDGTIAGVRFVATMRKTDIGLRRFKFVEDDGSNPVAVSASEYDMLTEYYMQDEMRVTKPAGGSYAAGDINSSDFGYRLTT